MRTQEKVLDNLIQMFCKKLRYSLERVQLVNFKNSEQRCNMIFSNYLPLLASRLKKGLY